MSLLSISLSALNAAQAGLATTGHNISNASTDGYNRQRIVQAARDTPQFTGSGFFGQGTQVETVQRIYSNFLSNQVMAATTAHSEFDTYSTEIKQIDNLLADDTAGLSPALQDFFKGVQELTSNPSSIPSRQSMLSSSASLVERFHAMNQRLTEISNGVQSQISESTQAINALARQVADLNQRIRDTEVAGSGVAANDLHDMRDQLIGKINEQVRVSTLKQSDGSINLFFGSGQPLVVGNNSYDLSAGPSPNNPSEQAIFTTIGAAKIVVADSLISGGVLGGLLRFRNEALTTAQNALGRLAVTVSMNMNAIQRQGQDLDGKLGGPFFNSLSPDVLKTSGTGTATVAAAFTEAQDLKTENYTLSYATATGYTMRRNSDGVTVYNGATPPNGTTTDPTDSDKTIRYGFSVNVTGAPADGDTWSIQPTAKAAQNLQLAIQDTRKIAAAAPFALSAELGNSGTAKIGNGTVMGLTGLDASADGVPDFNAITLTFNAATNTFSAVDSTGAAVPLRVRSGASTLDPTDPGTPAGTTAADNTYNPATDAAGKTFEFGSPAISFTISGYPNNGDAFRIATNPSGTSDNRNALRMAALQTSKTMLNGGASYEYGFSQLVSDIGTMSRDAEIGADAQQSLLDQAQASYQSLSGVNLDEEAANLIRYQQAYQAAARAMNIASSLFDEILAVARG